MKKRITILFLALVTVLSIFALSACGNNGDTDSEGGGETPPHTHSFGEWQTSALASCTEAGEEKRVCSLCEHSETRTTEVLGHNYGSWIAEIGATCTEDGTVGHYHCSGCNKDFDEDKNELSSLTIEKTGIHNFVDDICINCGKKIVYSEGLEFELVNNEYYKVKGIGTCADTELYIPKTYNNLPVKEIGSYAFENCTSLTSITIPNSVTIIGEEAFWGCTSLTSITIPNSVTSIGEWAFEYCYKLVEVINKSSLNITKGSDDYGYVAYDALEVHTGESKIVNKDGYLFYTVGGVNYLVTYVGNDTELILPESYNGEDYVINRCAFYNNDKITSVTIPNSVTSIGYEAFSSCTSLTSITIPNSVTSIGTYAFFNCDSLTSITIPNSVTIIGDCAFYDCESLTSVYISDISAWCKILFASYDANPLYYAKKLYLNGELVTELVIPSNVTSIGSYAFRDCRSLTSITIPDSVTSIGDYAFYWCTSLTSVTIGNSVTSIGTAAFRDCTSLTSVTIGNSVTSIGEWAFVGCTSLTSITIPNSVTSIGTAAFYGCTSLTSVTIGNSVTSIGHRAFSDCTSLTSITIPNSVTSIDTYAFENCTSLTSITIPDSVTSIGLYAFYDCESLTSVCISDISAWCKISFASYDANPLYYAKKLYLNGELVTELVIPSNVTSIGSYAFRDCTSLTSITIPDSVTSIGYEAFYNCTSLTSITIPNSVTSIGTYAFFNCDSLTSVVIGSNVTSIGISAFDNCSNLSSVTFNDTSTWYVTTNESDWQNKTGGSEVDEINISVPTNNAELFKQLFEFELYYYWYKK